MNNEINNEINIGITNNNQLNSQKFGLNKYEINEILDAYINRSTRKKSTKNELDEFELINKHGKEKGIAQKLDVSLSTGLITNLNDVLQVIDQKERINEFDENYVKHHGISIIGHLTNILSDKILVILIISAIIEIIMGAIVSATEWINGLLIIFSIFLILLYSCYTSYPRRKIIDGSKDNNTESNNALVIRNGKQAYIDSKKILVGDIVKIKSGDSLKADGILLEGSDLNVFERILLGDNEIIKKETYERCIEIKQRIIDTHSNLISNQINSIPSPLLFSGTDVIKGEGKYLVIAVGENTLNYNIQESTFILEKKKPFEEKIEGYTRNIIKYGLFIALTTLILLIIKFFINYSTNVSAYDNFINKNPSINIEKIHPNKSILSSIFRIVLISISIIVMAIPEGLKITLVLVIEYAYKYLYNEYMYVQNDHVFEKLGKVNYVCFDKTGTLTANEMQVCKYYDNNQIIIFKSYDDESNKQGINENKIMTSEPLNYIRNKEYFDILKLSICLNLDMIIKEDDSIEIDYITDKAFYNLMKRFGIKLFPFIKTYKIDRQSKSIPFSSSRKRMATFIQDSTGYRMLIKGGTDIILKCVDKYLDPSTCKTIELNEDKHNEIQKEINYFNEDSLRTISFAYKDISKEEFDNYERTNIDEDGVYQIEKSGFTLIGTAGIKDTLRDEIPLVINEFNESGINVIMFTGDNIYTAISIAKESNILQFRTINSESILSGDKFWDISGGLVCINCKKKENCRCPKNKKEAINLGLDSSFIRNDEIGNMEKFRFIAKDLKVLARARPLDKYLLVFGLKEDKNTIAVVGDGANDAPAISKACVGFALESGSPIAKDASDIIILDNKLSSIIKVIKYGRHIYVCIRIFIQFHCFVNISACSFILISAIIGNESALSAIQILWINLIIDSLGSLALTSENINKNILLRKSEEDNIISFKMWIYILFQTILFLSILLIFYFNASKFIDETMPYKILESKTILNCYGIFPGGAYNNQNNSFKILDGLGINWASDAIIKENISNIDCGIYSNSVTLNQAFNVYVSIYGNTTHMTMIYNIFVFYVLFNQICSRVIDDEINIFKGILNNKRFILIFLLELILQVFIIQYGWYVFNTSWNGLTFEQWLICIGISLICFVNNFLIKITPIEKCLRSLFHFIKRKFTNKKVNETVKDLEMKFDPYISMNEGIDNLENKKEPEKTLKEYVRQGSKSFMRKGSNEIRNNKSNNIIKPKISDESNQSEESDNSKEPESSDIKNKKEDHINEFLRKESSNNYERMGSKPIRNLKEDLN